MKSRSIALLLAAGLLVVVDPAVAEDLIDVFDYDAADTWMQGGTLNKENFSKGYGGLLPTAGVEYFASGNGSNNTFYDRTLGMTLDGVIADTPYRVFLNVAWYNTGQDGGVALSDFDELYVGSANGMMTWVYTPEPIVEDQWYTWEGIFTPAPADIGQPWTFFSTYDLRPHRDIALDLPANGFATPIPEPATLSMLALGGLAMLRRRRGHWRSIPRGSVVLGLKDLTSYSGRTGR